MRAKERMGPGMGAVDHFSPRRMGRAQGGALAGSSAVGVQVAPGRLMVAGQQIERRQPSRDHPGAPGIARIAQRRQQLGIGLARARIAVAIQELGIGRQCLNVVGISRRGAGQSGARSGGIAGRLHLSNLIEILCTPNRR